MLAFVQIGDFDRNVWSPVASVESSVGDGSLSDAVEVVPERGTTFPGGGFNFDVMPSFVDEPFLDPCTVSSLSTNWQLSFGASQQNDQFGTVGILDLLGTERTETVYLQVSLDSDPSRTVPFSIEMAVEL